MNTKKTLNALLAGAVVLTIAGLAGQAQANEGQEKCFGVVKAGHNDCAAADKSHSCAAQAAEDGGASEWVYLPEGTCDKLVGGTTATDEGEHAEEPAAH